MGTVVSTSGVETSVLSLPRRHRRVDGGVQPLDDLREVRFLDDEGRGEEDVVAKLKKGHQAIGRTYKNHIDGYNLLPYLAGEQDKSPRQIYFYFSDDGDVLAIRYDNWKVVFMEQRLQGTLGLWAEPFVRLRFPKIFNLRTDPYEFADVTSNAYWDWVMHNGFLMFAAQAAAGKFLGTFKEFPPAQHAGSFNLDDAMAKMSEAASGAHH